MFNFYYSLVLAFGLFFEVTIKERKRQKKKKKKRKKKSRTVTFMLWIPPLGCSIVDPINTDFAVQLFLGIEASICFENFGCSNIKEIVKI